MFYLMMHSTHLFTVIWYRSNSDNKRKPTAKTLSNWQQGIFYMHHPNERIVHTTTLATPVVEYWLEREIVQGVLW